MIELDVAGLVVIAGQVLGIGTDAALSQLDIAAAESALAEARLAGPEAASAATSRTGPAAGRRRQGPQARCRRGGRGRADARAAAPPAAARSRRAGGSRSRAAAPGRQRLAGQPGRAQGRRHHHPAPRLGPAAPADATSWLETRLSPDPASPERDTSVPAPLPPGSRARRILLAPVTAVRDRQHRRSGPGPFVIMLGSAGQALRHPHPGHRVRALHRPRPQRGHPLWAGSPQARPAPRHRALPARPDRRQ